MTNLTKIKVSKKYIHMIDEIYRDPDGYWCYTNKGFYSPETGCHTIHEDRQDELLKQIRLIQPCNCEQCRK